MYSEEVKLYIDNFPFFCLLIALFGKEINEQKEGKSIAVSEKVAKSNFLETLKTKITYKYLPSKLIILHTDSQTYRQYPHKISDMNSIYFLVKKKAKVAS